MNALRSFAEAVFLTFFFFGAIALLIGGISDRRDGMTIAGAIMLSTLLLIASGHSAGRSDRN